MTNEKIKEELPKGGFGTAGLVLSIIGLAFLWIPFNVMGILGIIFGAIAMNKKQRYGTASVIMGSVATVGAIILMIIFAITGSVAGV